jgi:hypothetical protein
MMTEHFESWYATLDTSLRNMVEGGLVATVCGWFGATLFATLAALAWVRGRLRAARAVVTAKEAALQAYVSGGCDTPAEPTPEPCSPPHSPLASVLLELFACGGVLPTDKGFKVGALSVVSLRPFRLIYPVDGTPTDMIPLLGEDDAEAVRKAAMGAWGRHSDAADDKTRERAVAALKAQVAVFRGEQPKPGRTAWEAFDDAVRRLEKRVDEIAGKTAV